MFGYGYLDFFMFNYPFTIGLFVVLAAVQILFCYKVKNFWISIIPSILFAPLFLAVGIPCMANVFETGPILILLFAVILPLQLLLCFKVRRLAVRLIPTILFPLTSIALLVPALSVSGWDGLGYLFLMILAAFAWVIDGIAWGMWGMIRHIQKHRGTTVME